jgi:hypothetical protein
MLNHASRGCADLLHSRVELPATCPRRTSVQMFLACLLLLLVLPAQALPLQGSWHPANRTDNANSVRMATSDSSNIPFDPVRLNAIPAGKDGAWISLRPMS